MQLRYSTLSFLGCQPLLASCHLDANRDGCAGDDRVIFVLTVVNIETALNGLHCDIADGQGVLDLFEIHLLWPLDIAITITASGLSDLGGD